MGGDFISRRQRPFNFLSTIDQWDLPQEKDGCLLFSLWFYEVHGAAMEVVLRELYQAL